MDSSGLVTWEANSPPQPVTEGDDIWSIWALGMIAIPYIDQDDDEEMASIYLGGVMP